MCAKALCLAVGIVDLKALLSEFEVKLLAQEAPEFSCIEHGAVLGAA